MDFYLVCRLAAGFGGILLLAALAGYARGKRRGHARGLAEGQAAGRLLLREEALLDGECPLCGTALNPTAPAGEPAGPSSPMV